MSDPLDPSTANDSDPDGADDYGPVEYETLEDRIFNTERDKESERRKAIRLENWMDMLTQSINTGLATNTAEVGCRAYTQGLITVRDRYHDDIMEIAEMKDDITMMVLAAIGSSDSIKTIQKRFAQVDINHPSRSDPQHRYRELSRPIQVPVRDSMLSEVETNYVEKAGMGGWIHRTILGFGLCDSERSGPKQDEWAEDEHETFNRILEERREEIESAISQYVKVNTVRWMNDGLDEKWMETLEDITTKMRTDHKNGVVESINVINEVA